MKNVLATVILSLVVGCHAAQTRTDGISASGAGSIQVTAKVDGNSQTVTAGQSLRSGTNFSVVAKPTTSSYFYLALVSGSRMPTIIVPASGEGAPRIEAGSSKTFPAAGAGFTLDEQPGPETLVAVFAPEPLNDAQLQSLLESAESSDATTRASGEKTRDVPPIATTATRGGVVPGSSSGPASGQQPVVTRLSFVHTGR